MRMVEEEASAARPAALTPLGAVVRGLVAGVVGTGGFDLYLFALYRLGGGQLGLKEWELSEDLTSWEQAPAPALVGKRLVEGLFQTRLPDSRARLVNNVTHWAYGVLNAVPYAIVVGSLATRRIKYGLPFGASVWASGYVVLPAAKLYKPIWEYDAKTLARDLSGHLVYGMTTAATMRLLSDH